MFTMAPASPEGVSIRDMLMLLTESGCPTTSSDPDLIRTAFIQKLQLKGGNGQSSFTRPAKMEIGTSATLNASKSRRKVEAAFFCSLCDAGFTRKNGLMSMYHDMNDSLLCD